MRKIIIALLVIIFSPIANFIGERYMTSLPEWIWNLASCLCVCAGVTIALLSDPIFLRLKDPKANPYISTLIVSICASIIVGSVWWFIIIKNNSEVQKQNISRGVLNCDPISKQGICINSTKHWLNMSSRQEMVKTRGDTAIYTEPDWRITSIYFEATNKRDKKIEKVKGYVESKETKQKINILIDSYKPEEIYGIPANTNFTIKAIFPKSTADREGWTFEEFWREFGAFTLYLDFDGIIITKQFNQQQIQEYIDAYIDSMPKRKQGKPRVQRKIIKEINMDHIRHENNKSSN